MSVELDNEARRRLADQAERHRALVKQQRVIDPDAPARTTVLAKKIESFGIGYICTRAMILLLRGR